MRDTNYPADVAEDLNVPDFDRSLLEHRTYTPPLSGRYRALPLLSNGQQENDQARAKHCDRNGGHVLEVVGREIRCRLCPVVYRDEGF